MAAVPRPGPSPLSLIPPAPAIRQNTGQPHKDLKVFISYCHADEETRHRVQLLAERLTQADGQDVRLDMIKPASISWPQWINTQFIECDKWVVVCDAEYKRRVDEPDAAFPGGGVSIEYFRMLNHLYDGKGANNKIVPVYFSDSERLEVVPQALQHYTCYGVDIPTEIEKITSSEWKGYSSFYMHGLCNQPKADLGVRAIQPSLPFPAAPLSRWPKGESELKRRGGETTILKTSPHITPSTYRNPTSQATVQSGLNQVPPKQVLHEGDGAVAGPSAVGGPKDIPKVTLFQLARLPAAEAGRVPSIDSPLRTGMQFVAYFTNDDMEDVVQQVLQSLEEIPLPTSSFLLEYARSNSFAVYLNIVRDVSSCSIDRLRIALNKRGLFVKISSAPGACDDVFEVKRDGGVWALFRIERQPIIDRVLHAVIDSNRGSMSCLVVHGSYLFNSGRLDFMWRVGPTGPLMSLTRIHRATLRERCVEQLIEEPDSIAVTVPEGLEDGAEMHLEVWRGQESVGGRVPINLSRLFMESPPPLEPGPSTRPPNRVPEWAQVAKTLHIPSMYVWDVFISHAGDSADKPFARKVKYVLERCWQLRIFLDDESLEPGTSSREAMDHAMNHSQLGLILFSHEFFQREATVGELRHLVTRQRNQRIRLLPVFLRVTVEEAKVRLDEILGEGDFLHTTGIRHKGELKEGLPKTEPETVWHIAESVCRQLQLDWRQGIERYKAPNG